MQADVISVERLRLSPSRPAHVRRNFRGVHGNTGGAMQIRGTSREWRAGELLERMRCVRGLRCLAEFPLSEITSFKVGGPADLLVVADGVESLRSVLRILHGEGIGYLVIGEGTNVIFSDAGFRGVVLKLGPGFDGLSNDGLSVSAGASGLLERLVSFCVGRGLSGLEKMAGIPGSVGGALSGNAGAFGVSIGDRVEWIRSLTPAGEDALLPRAALDFAYRRAHFGSEAVLTEVGLELEHGDARAMQEETKAILERRSRTQPYQYPCAGSIFKNPPGFKAARLIEEAGFKGRRVGGAEVSSVHANFIVNTGGASAGDILRLIGVVTEEVAKRFSVTLELEVRIIQ
ncbi:MAG: UDP-N-acetylmuramate dehydrogenase [Candidatus Eisenbacteria bacterium]